MRVGPKSSRFRRDAQRRRAGCCARTPWGCRGRRCRGGGVEGSGEAVELPWAAARVLSRETQARPPGVAGGGSWWLWCPRGGALGVVPVARGGAGCSRVRGAGWLACRSSRCCGCGAQAVEPGPTDRGGCRRIVGPGAGRGEGVVRATVRGRRGVRPGRSSAWKRPVQRPYGASFRVP